MKKMQAILDLLRMEYTQAQEDYDERTQRANARTHAGETMKMIMQEGVFSAGARLEAIQELYAHIERYIRDFGEDK